jgi:hypothetical protein
MKGSSFPEANLKLLPPEGQGDKVYPLPIWRHPEGGMVISKWEMTWRERLACLFYGHVWFHCWGNTHPPISIETSYPFIRETPEGPGLTRLLPFLLLLSFAAWAAGIMIVMGAWKP